MTHDELLAKIEPKQKTAGEWLEGFEALRAVVEYIYRDRTIAIDIPLTDYERGIRDADGQILAIIEKELK